MYSQSTFILVHFVQCFQLATLGALFFWAQCDISLYKKLYLLLFCYEPIVGPGWREAYCVHGVYKTRTRSQTYLWELLCILQVNPWVFTSCKFFCPIITSTNCIDWVHEICAFLVKSKAKSGESNACFWERKLTLVFWNSCQSIGLKSFYRESRLMWRTDGLDVKHLRSFLVCITV